MAVHTLLWGGRYTYVLPNPTDLVSITGKREIVKPLQTLDPAKAKRQVRSPSNEVDRVFAEARRISTAMRP